MKLYSEQVNKIDRLLSKVPSRQWPYLERDCAAVAEKNEIIFRNATAFELGGMGLPSVCTVVFCDEGEVSDGVSVYGRDLCDLKADSPFAHVIRVGLDSKTEEGELDFEKLKDIEFSLYRLSLSGYSVQIAPLSDREQVRVGLSAVEKGLSFYNVGCSYIREFKSNPLVKSVRVSFVTEPSFDYKALSAVAKKVKTITKAVTSRFGNQALDCSSCTMKPICDEVEGLRELHFKSTETVK